MREVSRRMLTSTTMSLLSQAPLPIETVMPPEAPLPPRTQTLKSLRARVRAQTQMRASTRPQSAAPTLMQTPSCQRKAPRLHCRLPARP